MIGFICPPFSSIYDYSDEIYLIMADKLGLIGEKSHKSWLIGNTQCLNG